MTKIIGLTGPAGCGKDTIAKFFVDICSYHRYALADPIKEVMNPLFGWDDRHGFGDLKERVDPIFGVSPRYVYQTFGTEYCRSFLGSDIWIKIATQRMGGYSHVVIPDIRFENEADWVRKHGKLWHIKRDRIRGVNPHVSENGVEFKPGDFVFENNMPLNDLWPTLYMMNDYA